MTEEKDIVERLHDEWHPNFRPLYKDAAAEIERLRDLVGVLTQRGFDKEDEITDRDAEITRLRGSA